MASKKNLDTSELEISLLPEQTTDLERALARRFRFLLGLVGFLVFGQLAVLVLVNFQKRAQQKTLRAAQAEQGAAQRKRDELQTQLRLRAEGAALLGFAEKALTTHQDFNAALILLQKTTLPEVRLTRLALDRKGTLVVGLETVSLSALANQMQVWKKEPAITNFRISQLALKAVGKEENVPAQIEAHATLTLAPSVLQWRISEVKK